jgi:hypothetical protein
LSKCTFQAEITPQHLHYKVTEVMEQRRRSVGGTGTYGRMRTAARSLTESVGRTATMRYKGRKIRAKPELGFRSPWPPSRVPFLGRDLPDFRWQPATNEVSLFGGNDTHSLPLRNSARGLIGNRLGNSQGWKFQHIEPIIGDGIGGFAHEALPLPRQAEPEPSIVIFRSHQTDGADHARRIALEPQGPVPSLSPFDRRKSDISTIRQRTVGWIRPRHPAGQKLHQFPVGKNNLNLFGVGEFERTQPQPFCFEYRCHTKDLSRCSPASPPGDRSRSLRTSSPR